MKSLIFWKRILISCCLPVLGACAGSITKAGLEPKGLGANDVITLEMSGDVNLTYTDKQGAEHTLPLGDDSLSFTIVNQKPNDQSKPGTSFTSMYVRPLEDSFSKPGIRIHQGVDHCTRDENGDPVITLDKTSVFNEGVQPYMKIGSDIVEMSLAPTVVTGTVEGARVTREGGTDNRYNREQLLAEITYENPGSIGDCKLTKNTIISESLNGAINFKLVNVNPKAQTGGTGGSGSSSTTGAPGGAGTSGAAAPSGGCSLAAGASTNFFSGPGLFWLGAFLWGAWTLRFGGKR